MTGTKRVLPFGMGNRWRQWHRQLGSSRPGPTLLLRQCWHDRFTRMDIMHTIPPLDIDGVSASAHKRHEEAKALYTHGGHFNAASLGAWLVQVQGAGLAHVPAKMLTVVPREAFLRIETPESADKHLWDDLQQRLSSLPARHMARWDHCSSQELKQPMAEGRCPTHAEATSLQPWDPRAFDLANAFAGDDIIVWSRPWIDALMVASHPVEFRVFVSDSKVAGVASYYPQRPLPATIPMLSFAGACLRMSEQLIAHMNEAGLRPWVPECNGLFDPSKVHATLDYLVTAAGEVLFLEAGPPFGAGAHPCAFAGQPISGVALRLAPGVSLR